MRVPTHLVALVAIASLGVARPAPAQRPRADTAEAREVAAVRALYRDVVRAVDAHELTRRDSTFACSDHDLGQTVSIWASSDSTIRRLKRTLGTDDHAQTEWFYYDRAGHLRFHFITFGAVNGTLQEERFYYAVDGRVIRHLVRQTHGPGYPFHADRPIWKPAAWLRRPCSVGEPRSDGAPG